MRRGADRLETALSGPAPADPPLVGVRVVDLSNTFMGPYCSRLMADLGADVVKVEGLDGDVVRNVGVTRGPGMGSVFLNTNRGKRGVALDLKSAAGHAALLRVLAGADVFLHNIRAEAINRLNLGPDTVRAVNPRVVYCALVGFGSGGPYQGRAAYDDVIQAVSGMASVQTDGGQPNYVRQSIADKTVALMAQSAILAALLRRERTGRGEVIEVPMFEAMTSFNLLELQGGWVFDPPAGPPGYARTASPYRRPYRTADGYLAVMVYTDRQWASFFELARRAELAEDPRFRSIDRRTEHINELYQLVEQALRERTTAEWTGLLGAAGIASTPVLDIAGLFTDEHLEAVRFFDTVAHPSEGPLRQARYPITFTEAHTPPTGPAPRLGEHSREVLTEAGLTPAEIDQLIRDGVLTDG